MSLFRSDKKSPRRLIICILLVTLAICAGVMIVQRIQAKIGHKTYDEALKIATQAPPSSQPKSNVSARQELKDIPSVHDPYVSATLNEIYLSSLQNVNPDVLGWLYIPGTGISYPFMKTDDNEFYLTHDWKGQKYIDGAIFVDCRNSIDGTDFNTIIYGHNKEDGYMFSDLMEYKKQDYYTHHPYIYLLTPGGIFRYRIFSAHELEADGYAYQLKNMSAQDFLKESKERSVIKTNTDVDPNDKIITLSTCNGYLTDTRFVVQAVMDGILK